MTKTATRPLFQEEPRPDNDEVAMSGPPFHPSSLYGQESRNHAGLRGFGHFGTQHRIQHSRGICRHGQKPGRLRFIGIGGAHEDGLEISNPKLLATHAWPPRIKLLIREDPSVIRLNQAQLSNKALEIIGRTPIVCF